MSALDLLRVIRKGPAVKDRVDAAIDQCSDVYNLRDYIEEARARAEQATSEHQKRMYAQKGIFHYHIYYLDSTHRDIGLHNLRRYFRLIVFQAYLQSTEPDTMQSFQRFDKYVQDRPGTNYIYIEMAK
jgi:hypothetical protein